jgi:hypothetical protein
MDRRSLLIGLGLTGLGAVTARSTRGDGPTLDQGEGRRRKEAIQPQGVRLGRPGAGHALS